MEWFKNPENKDYEKFLEIEIAGVPHTFAWGGLHGAIKKYNSSGYFVIADVGSYYPSLMIAYEYISRSVQNPKLYEEIYHTRLKYKAQKDPRQAPYKIVLNSTYGAMKDKFNALYDPLMANNVCVSGQILLLDLLERFEENNIKIIQTNTDGVLVKLNARLAYNFYENRKDDIATITIKEEKNHGKYMNPFFNTIDLGDIVFYAYSFEDFKEYVLSLKN